VRESGITSKAIVPGIPQENKSPGADCDGDAVLFQELTTY
jgi:hypothetical protein